MRQPLPVWKRLESIPDEKRKKEKAMKLMFASDIHGDASCCQRMLDCFDAEQAEKLILLGDLLYHGPRNDLPPDYAPKKVIELLNARKEQLLCVRGNCDTEVDQMVLQFPILADYAAIFERGRMWFLTHGHVYNQQKMPPVAPGTILIHGHTHVQTVTEQDGIFYLNPGSVTLPKEGNPKSYMIYEDGLFTIRTMDGEILGSYAI